jgi:hypothetical protein
MADISDVENALAGALTSILYPFGTSQSSIVSVLCRVYRGWPNSATLNTDLSAGVVNVTIVTDSDSGHVTTRYLPEWRTTVSSPGTTAAAFRSTITISGTPATGDVVGALIDGRPYTYRVQDRDTPGLIASNLCQSIQVIRLAIARGTVITVPGASAITARVVCDNNAAFESRRQEKDVRIICWCPTPPVRDIVASAIDSAVDQLSFLPLADGTAARVIYRNTASYDQAQNALLYRRDLVYTIEYPTVTSIQQPSLLFGASGLNANITFG